MPHEDLDRVTTGLALDRDRQHGFGILQPVDVADALERGLVDGWDAVGGRPAGDYLGRVDQGLGKLRMLHVVQRRRHVFRRIARYLLDLGHLSAAVPGVAVAGRVVRGRLRRGGGWLIGAARGHAEQHDDGEHRETPLQEQRPASFGDDHNRSPLSDFVVFNLRRFCGLLGATSVTALTHRALSPTSRNPRLESRIRRWALHNGIVEP
ncbi:hypothetical protein [Phytoactinopolyspora endophytica]|uniref:hypothetical protein n=1 Tax=Phytoactinopolyspora endophytica TaxID=1642495 RepID=UPI00197C870E|nr:hypothetical protein [Phytoactinopolyspora endophytica]